MMNKECQTRQMAEFALRVNFDDIGQQNIDQLKRHLLDSLGSLFYATTRPTILKLVKQLQLLSEGGPCKVPGPDGLAPDRAAQLYTALIRYPDFMDNFMGKEATCHPSDTLGPILAAVQRKKTSGKDLLTAMAIAYQIECRLVLEIPVMKEGIDHTLVLAYGMVASISKIYGLSKEQTAHALAIVGCSTAPMVTSRASYTSEWKGLASSMVALNAINVTLLAEQELTGPIAIFEGPKGFKDIFDMKLDYNWSQENFELIQKCVLKKYNAEVHSQSSIEALLLLQKEHAFNIADIRKIDITTFLTSYHIIGGGAYGDRKIVHSKEQADHSLFYLAAVALLDGEIYPEQLLPERIKRDDVQELLQKVFVHTGFPLHQPVMVAGLLDPYTQAYPDKVKSKAIIHLNNGKKLEKEVEDYPGFFTRPFTWEETIKKFKRLSDQIVEPSRQEQIIETVRSLDQLDSDELIQLITKVVS